MVYLVIKELSTIAEDVIMVTSSIMKDMQPNLEVVYRANAIRALARIIDVSEPRPMYYPTPKTLSLIEPGPIRPFRRALFQNSPSRPFILHLVRLAHLVIPPLPPLALHHQALVKRGAGSRQCQSCR